MKVETDCRIKCSPPNVRERRILMVVRDQSFCRRAKTRLTRAGYAVDWAADSAAAWHALAARPYHLFITDRVDPWFSGLESIARRFPGLSVPTLLISGSTVVGVANPSSRPMPWFNAFLHKPAGGLNFFETVGLILGEPITDLPPETHRGPLVPALGGDVGDRSEISAA